MSTFANKMVEIARDPDERACLRTRARQLDPEFPHNGCASMMSALVERTLVELRGSENFPAQPQVLAFAEALIHRGWQKIALGHEQAGDIVITENDPTTRRPAHTYLLVKQRTPDVWLILDNQAQTLHLRSLSGKGGKTPAAYCLRSNA